MKSTDLVITWEDEPWLSALIGPTWHMMVVMGRLIRIRLKFDTAVSSPRNVHIQSPGVTQRVDDRFQRLLSQRKQDLSNAGLSLLHRMRTLATMSTGTIQTHSLVMIIPMKTGEWARACVSVCVCVCARDAPPHYDPRLVVYFYYTSIFLYTFLSLKFYVYFYKYSTCKRIFHFSHNVKM